MAAFAENASMALFCDFENIALGVRDAQYEKFDIRPVLERLLAKGSIVVKKAYCDWDRYKTFKSAMHEANFELIEIPHVRQSGKNSADIRMVVDALDLCYTKSHVDTFVIISGDSDFSPLVSKLRENAKRVIGVGVKQSCSDLLVTNCDEFIYYDDLVRDREAVRSTQRREREKRSPEEEAKRREKQEERKAKAIDIVSATFVDLMADRGDSDRIWASVLKEVVKRRNPGFNESYYGFRTFGNLLEEAANRGLIGFGRDEKGAFVFRAPARPAQEGDAASETPMAEVLAEGGEPLAEPAKQNETGAVVTEDNPSEAAPVGHHGSARGQKSGNRRRNGRRDRRQDNVPEANAPLNEAATEFTVSPMPESEAMPAAAVPVVPVQAPEVQPETSSASQAGEPAGESEEETKKPRRRAAAKTPRKKTAKPATEVVAEVVAVAAAPSEPSVAPAEVGEAAPAAAKPARRNPRSRKPKASAES